MPVLFVVRLFWLPPAKRAFMAAHETNSIANGALAEGINGVRTIQSLDRQKVNFDLYEEKARENLRPSDRGQVRPGHGADRRYADRHRHGDRHRGGGQMVLNGGLDVGVMVAFLFYIQRFFDPIRSLTMQYSVMQRAMASGQRITEVLDVPVEITDKPDAIDCRRHGRLGRVPQRDLRLPQGPAGAART
jgi:ATP-binding cassette, subfamily B, multidrug efflux pump